MTSADLYIEIRFFNSKLRLKYTLISFFNGAVIAVFNRVSYEIISITEASEYKEFSIPESISKSPKFFP